MLSLANLSPLASYALLVALVMVIIWLASSLFGGREGFVSKQAREVHASASEVFSKGAATYTDYKKRVPGADPVQFSDMRRLHAAGDLTPAAVQRVL